MRNLIARTRVFFSIIVILFLITALNLYLFRKDFAALANKVFSSQDPEVEHWQNWARYYSKLFGMLRKGERIGIQMEGSKSSGILLEKTDNGMIALRTVFLQSEKPGLVFVLPPDTAQDFLNSVRREKPDAIWPMMKDALYERRMTIWNDPDIARLHRGGHLALMRAVDTRPPGLDWPTIKRMLNEK